MKYKFNVLVTGGAKGLGRDLCRWFADKGADVYVIDKTSKASLDSSFLLRLKDYYQIDLSDRYAIEDFVADCINNKIVFHILIVNAFPRYFKYFIEFSHEEISDFVNIAFTNHLFLMQVLLKKMIHRSFGRIFIIGSKSSFQGYSNGSLYCSLKKAYIGIYESLSRELRNTDADVTLSLIHPDAFSNIDGKEYKVYDKLLNKITKCIDTGIHSNKSNVYHVYLYKTRIMGSIRLVKAMIDLWKR